MRRSRTYQLTIEVAKPVTVAVGRLGDTTFPAGCYVYTGSAKRNLIARVARHLSAHKRNRWHIDYLLSAPGVRITNVRFFARSECALNRATKGDVVVRGFGASDCRMGCGAHLKYINAVPQKPRGRRKLTNCR